MTSQPVTNLVEVVNISAERMTFELDSMIYVLKPKDTAKIHKSYALRRVMQKDRDSVPSVVELLTAGKVLPITHPRARRALGLKPLTAEEIEAIENPKTSGEDIRGPGDEVR